jgi:hypothetical protein
MAAAVTGGGGIGGGSGILTGEASWRAWCSPMVMVLTSPDVDRVCHINNLSFAELLKPWGTNVDTSCKYPLLITLPSIVINAYSHRTFICVGVIDMIISNIISFSNSWILCTS